MVIWKKDVEIREKIGGNLEILILFGNFGKKFGNLNFFGNLEKIGNLEKNWKSGKKLETWKTFGNLKNIWNQFGNLENI